MQAGALQAQHAGSIGGSTSQGRRGTTWQSAAPREVLGGWVPPGVLGTTPCLGTRPHLHRGVLDGGGAVAVLRLQRLVGLPLGLHGEHSQLLRREQRRHALGPQAEGRRQLGRARSACTLRCPISGSSSSSLAASRQSASRKRRSGRALPRQPGLAAWRERRARRGARFPPPRSAHLAVVGQQHAVAHGDVLAVGVQHHGQAKEQAVGQAVALHHCAAGRAARRTRSAQACSAGGARQAAGICGGGPGGRRMQRRPASPDL